MKKIITLVLCMGLSFSLIACSKGNVEETKTSESEVQTQAEETKTDDALEKIKEKGEIIVATSPDYPPYEFKIMEDGKEKIVGFDIDIAREIADDMGVKLRILEQNFDGLLVGLNAGNSDIVMAGMSPDEKRKKAVDFSDIYYKATQGILVLDKNKEDITTLESLSGKKIGVQKGSIQESLAKEQLPDAKLVSLTKVPNIILELKTGNIDAAIIEVPVAQGYVNNHDDLALASVTIDDETGGSAIAIKKGNTSLVDSINDTLKRLEEEGLVDKFVQDANNIVNNME